MFADVILALAQRSGGRDTVCIGGHRPCQTRAVFVVVVDVKLNPRKRNAASDCGFADADETGIGFVRRGDFVGLAVFHAVNLGREHLIRVMLRGLYFRNAVASPFEPVCFRTAVCAGGQRGDDRADSRAV